MKKIMLSPEEKRNAFASSLSCSSKSGLIIHFNDWKIVYQPWKIAEFGKKELRLAKHLKAYNIKEIAEALYDYGYIESPYWWLKL